ncbi:LuxR C-terminal-related transcriptional regulator [Novosphingobium sp. G106]|uniref:LuxR C-terminal-related transcriptional regulator n=1 Tax=Novosphingobium sp. G106 TaxID=2849500 RepID=UPI0035C8518C
MLAGIAEGRINRLTGKYLGISPRTAELHRANLQFKIKAKCSAKRSARQSKRRSWPSSRWTPVSREGSCRQFPFQAAHVSQMLP